VPQEAPPPRTVPRTTPTKAPFKASATANIMQTPPRSTNSNAQLRSPNTGCSSTNSTPSPKKPTPYCAAHNEMMRQHQEQLKKSIADAGNKEIVRKRRLDFFTTNESNQRRKIERDQYLLFSAEAQTFHTKAEHLPQVST